MISNLRISKEFFRKSTIDLAKSLLGCTLVHKTSLGKFSGKIVETEAYLEKDPASHSYSGKKKRNSVMFDSAGHAYVYFTYGMHHCFNVVANKEGIGEAVLIRALEPLEGIEIMKKLRKKSEEKNLCNGPAKLVQAMNIKKYHNGLNLLSPHSKLYILKGDNYKKIVSAKRIGISKAQNKLLRFYIKGNEFISRK